MKLDELIEYLDYKDLVNFKNIDITGISYNSKTTKKGDIFICLVGEHTDGHEFALNAIENGAVALLTEKKVENISIPQIIVSSTRYKIADIADRFYSSPSKGINLIGITGTNGKTTVTHLLQKIFEENEQKCALIGTLGYKLSSNGEYRDAKHTTPQAPELQATLRMIKDVEKIENVVMEVSSHALEQNRVGGCCFNGAVLTNLTQDHLDYHKTMENYALAKQKLFYNLKENGIGIINSDDKYNNYFKIGNYVEYGINNKDYKIEEYHLDYKINFKLNIKGNLYNVKSNLIGKYNMYNLLCAITVLDQMNISINDILSVVEFISTPPGRTDIINYKNNLIIIDYAHTPDAMENIYDLVKEINKGSVYTVFGCTGDRDRTKRPIMMDLATTNSKYVIFTSDDLHNEDFKQIVSDSIEGIDKTNFEIIMNRGKAIEKGISMLDDKDILLILGKGHEEFIIIRDKKIPFNDKEEVNKLIKTHANI